MESDKKIDLDVILDEALDKCLNGVSIDNVLKDYAPTIAVELKPLLEVADSFQNIEQPKPTGQAVFKALSTVKGNTVSQNKIIRFPRFIMKIAASFVVVCSLLFGLNLASANTIPGDNLYFVKKIGEKIQYAITPTQSGKVELKLIFSRKRMAELLEKNRNGDVSDLTLVYEMLQETQESLEKLSEIEPIKRGLLFRSIRNANRSQVDALSLVTSNSTTSKNLELIKQTCECREQWFKQVNAEKVRQSGCGCGADDCCCPPAIELLESSLARFPQY